MIVLNIEKSMHCLILKKRQKKRLLTQEEKEKERLFSIVFSFIVLSVGMYGYIIDSYTDSNNPLIPNLLNIITGMNILPDEQSMFLDNYYIKNQSMSPIIVNGKSTIAFDIGKQQENKVSGIWFYMIMCFLPVFIIALSGVKVEKIDKNKIRRFLKEWSKHI